MARSKPLTISGVSFQTQKDAQEYIQGILYRYPLKTPIPEPDHSFLCALVSLHPSAAEKIGTGIDHFTVEKALGGTVCFYVTRTDGSRSDFSFGKCLRGK